MSEHLCVSCSICCDGTLYQRVAVTEQEIERLKGRGDFFTKTNGDLRMRLGCTNLKPNGACAVYQDRPRVCARYRCHLLKRVESGETKTEDAAETVQHIKAVRAITWECVAKAMGRDAVTKISTSLHDAIEQLEVSQVGPEPTEEFIHAMLCYDHLIKLIRLHLKPNFREAHVSEGPV